MEKGRFVLLPAAIAVIAFAFCVIWQPILVLLTAGYALLAEKDEWLKKQTLQALLLMISYYLAELAFSWIFGGLSKLFLWCAWQNAASIMSVIGVVANDVIQIALIVFCLIGGLRVLRGKDAGLPLLAKMAEGDFAAALAPKPKPSAPPTKTHHKKQAAVTPTGRYCTVCAAPMLSNAKFCVRCGTAVPVPIEKPADPLVAGTETMLLIQTPSPEPAAEGPSNETKPSLPAEDTVPAEAPVSDEVYCVVCAAPLVQDASFCIKCGAKRN